MSNEPKKNKSALPTSQTNCVQKYISTDGKVRISSLIATELVQELCEIQGTAPAASVFLGRTAIAAALLASNQQLAHRIGLEFRGDGPISRVFVEASHEGLMRCYCSNPNYQGIDKNGQLLVAEGIGKGQLIVEINQPNHPQPYRGTVEIQTGEVGDDIAHYLFQSHQIPSIVSLGVQVSAEGELKSAAGLLIELMPNHSEDLILKLEENALRAPSIIHALEAGAQARDLVDFYLRDIAIQPLEHPFTLRHHCRCSKERVIRSLSVFNTEELNEMILEGKETVVVCEFCKQKYCITAEDLTHLLTMH
jgi:molecular chaperone Hsp33